MDGSTRRGPYTWLRRVPSSDRFRFHHPADFGIALSVDLLTLAPGMHDQRYCIQCAEAGRQCRIPLDGRHFVPCPHGIRLGRTASDRVRDALVSLCDSVFGASRVIAERPGSHTAINHFMATAGAGLLHRPDLLIRDLDGPGSYTLIDVKVFDPAGDTHVAVHHSDTTRLAVHSHMERVTPRIYFGPTDSPPDHLRVRLVTFTLSTFGALGAQSQTFISRLAALTGRVLPAALLDESTWATPLFPSFARQAITLAIRRSLATAIRDSFCSEERSTTLRAHGQARRATIEAAEAAQVEAADRSQHEVEAVFDSVCADALPVPDPASPVAASPALADMPPGAPAVSHHIPAWF